MKQRGAEMGKHGQRPGSSPLQPWGLFQPHVSNMPSGSWQVLTFTVGLSPRKPRDLPSAQFSEIEDLCQGKNRRQAFCLPLPQAPFLVLILSLCPLWRDASLGLAGLALPTAVLSGAVLMSVPRTIHRMARDH